MNNRIKKLVDELSRRPQTEQEAHRERTKEGIRRAKAKKLTDIRCPKCGATVSMCPGDEPYICCG